MELYRLELCYPKERLKLLTQHRQDLSEQLKAEMQERAEKRAKARTETQIGLIKDLKSNFQREKLSFGKNLKTLGMEKTLIRIVHYI